jgi:hypothetical protein
MQRKIIMNLIDAARLLFLLNNGTNIIAMIIILGWPDEVRLLLLLF